MSTISLGKYTVATSQAKVTTPDANSTEIDTHAVQTGCAMMVRARIVGRKGDDSAVFVIEARAKNVLGTVTIHDATTVFTSADAGAAAWTASLDASGTNIRCMCGGEASVEWCVFWEILEM